MIEISDKKDCCGCSACVNACPKKCISLKEDSEGFLYPSIDKEKCINCNICVNVCPIKSKKCEKMDVLPEAYLCYSKNVEDRINSASGGAFFEIAKKFIENKKGVVVGAAYDNDFLVHHIIVDNVKDLLLLQKSKYVQSRMENIFEQVKEKLSLNISVLFSGTPCQVAGIKRYIPAKLQDNLYCTDFSCYGVPSPKVFKKYIDYQNTKHGGINKIIIRDKKIMKRSFRVGYGILFNDGYKYFAPHGVDPMARTFFSNMCIRPSCYDCSFKTIGRISDITLGDCWYSDYFIKDFKDKYGITMVLVQSSKGKSILDLTDNLEKTSVDTEKIVKINGGMIFDNPRINEKRDEFFADINSNTDNNFDEIVSKYVAEKNDSFKYKLLTFLKENSLLPKKIRNKMRYKEINKRLNKKIPEEAKEKYV